MSPSQDPARPEEGGAVRGRLLPRRRLLALLQQADQGGAGAVHVEEAAPVGGAPGHLRRRHEQEGRHPGRRTSSSFFAFSIVDDNYAYND